MHLFSPIPVPCLLNTIELMIIPFMIEMQELMIAVSSPGTLVQISY